eukprot:jgi/Astpho2/520/e_gw1.00011.257.1_t
MSADTNSATFSVADEDHTLGNALRFFLNKNPNVAFCGYSIPHPTENMIYVRVQTIGDVTAEEAFKEAVNNLKAVCGVLKERMETALEKFRAEHPRSPDAMGT